MIDTKVRHICECVSRRAGFMAAAGGKSLISKILDIIQILRHNSPVEEDGLP